jgi:hypothetical protein
MQSAGRKPSQRLVVCSLLTLAVGVVLIFWSQSGQRNQELDSENSTEPAAVGTQTTSQVSPEKPAPAVAERAEATISESDGSVAIVYPARLASVLGQSDAHLDVPSRIARLQAQGALSGKELAAIYSYLGDEANSSGLVDAHWLWLKNDLMTYMRESDTDRSRYFKELSGLFTNHGDPVIRDYALQHLTVMALGGEYEIKVRDVLKEGAVVKEGTIAGTALLGYSRLPSEQQENVDWLHSAAEDVAGSDDYDSASRASALQVLAKLDERVADTLASEKALEVASPAIERVSAVAVLGRSRENFDTLKQLASDADPRVRRAARLAITKLQTQ